MKQPITFPADLQPLIEREMAHGRFSTPGELLRRALELWVEHHETRTTLEEALAEADSGLGRPWEQVDREFRERNHLPVPQ